MSGFSGSSTSLGRGRRLPVRIIKPGCTKFDHIPVFCVLDSGASHAVLRKKYCCREILPSNISIKTVNGENLLILGITKAQICLGNTVHCVELVVSNVVDEVLLSTGFLTDMGAIWNFRETTIEIASLPNFEKASRIIVSNVLCCERYLY